jgi:hypothetical protein
MADKKRCNFIGCSFSSVLFCRSIFIGCTRIYIFSIQRFLADEIKLFSFSASSPTQPQRGSTRSLPAPKMGHGEGEREHEGDDLSADDSSWSDGIWSEDDDEVEEFLTSLSLNFFLVAAFYF